MVTVIIPTYNGAHKVMNTLGALEHQTYKKFETIVVVDGSVDNTVKILKDAQLNLYSLRVIVQDNKGRAAVRNRGVEEATGEIIIFFDDDMRPVENCVFKHVAHHQSNPETILAGNQMEEATKMETDIQRYKANLGSKWLGKFPDKKIQLTFDNMFLTAANFSISKDLFQKLGGFDERLNDAEDILFSLKAHQKNIPIFFDKSALAWHDDFISCRSYIKRLKEYKEAREMASRLSDDYKVHLSKLFVVQDRKNWRRKLKRLFCAERFVKLIDSQSPFLQIIPTKIRYRIYSMIIWESTHL